MISTIILGIVMTLVINPRLRVVIHMEELLELSPLNQFFYLLFQIMTFITGLAMIFVETTEFLQVSLLGRGS